MGTALAEGGDFAKVSAGKNRGKMGWSRNLRRKLLKERLEKNLQGHPAPPASPQGPPPDFSETSKDRNSKPPWAAHPTA